jgi:phenylpropionate dioxygenase-like ring-hydroxylating dioxygenase large terminal subunit
MGRAALVAMARRNLAHLDAGTIDQAPEVGRVPASVYVDPERHRREVDLVFRRLPLVLALSCELAGPGTYRALDVAGVPVLVVRGVDGAVRAFVNMCSHRGAQLVEEGTGVSRRFACPYHAWTYDLDGSLVGIFQREDFGDVDPTCLGLTPLPVLERAGLVWGIVSPGSRLDIAAFLSGYDELLGLFGFERWHVVSRRVVPGPNWKIAYDGYLDLYHLPVLHRATFGPRIPNRALYDAWGPHQRVTAPNPKYRDLLELPEDEWPLERLLGGVWTIFPHVSIATFDTGVRGVLVSQLFPGADVGSSTTIQTYLVDHEPDDDERAAAEQQAAFLEHVVREEDYRTGLRQHRALAAGVKPEVLFGRNEGGGQRFHAWVDRVLSTADPDLPALFAH